jgi:hypothetical protein
MLLGCAFGCLGRFTLYPAPVRIAGLFLRTLGKGRVRDQRTSSELAQPMAGADGRSRKIRYLRRRETAITYCADALYHTLWINRRLRAVRLSVSSCEPGFYFVGALL